MGTDELALARMAYEESCRLVETIGLRVEHTGEQEPEALLAAVQEEQERARHYQDLARNVFAGENFLQTREFYT